MFAHFVARAIVLVMRFFVTRVAYADNFGRTFARGMASCTACAAHSVRTRASVLAMPRLRAHCTIIWARCAGGSVRFRSTVSANHVYRACDAMRFDSDSLLFYSGLARTSAARPLTYLRSGLARTSAARPLLIYTPVMIVAGLAETAETIFEDDCGNAAFEDTFTKDSKKIFVFLFVRSKFLFSRRPPTFLWLS